MEGLRALRKLIRCSEQDECYIVRVVCCKCDATFEEEFEAARAIVIAAREFVCLSCDGAAAEPAFSGITVEIGWSL